MMGFFAKLFGPGPKSVEDHHKGEYDKAWQDVHKAQSLGFQVPAELLKALREVSEGEGHDGRITSTPVVD